MPPLFRGLSFRADAAFATLSAGLKRRTMLGRALCRQPELLLLDEPTNHLDIDSIGWMEDFLLRFEGSILFVTHDRMFLRRLATRIVELDRGRLTSMPGNYDAYLKRKEAELAAEETQREVFDKKLAQEEVWIRQGVKARRTRNEGRVRELEQMRTAAARAQARAGHGADERCGCRHERQNRLRGDRRHFRLRRQAGHQGFFNHYHARATASASSAPTARARQRSSGCCWGS